MGHAVEIATVTYPQDTAKPKRWKEAAQPRGLSRKIGYLLSVLPMLLLNAVSASASETQSSPLPRMSFAGCLAILDAASRKICLDKQHTAEAQASQKSTTTPSSIGEGDDSIPDFDVDKMCAKAYGNTEIQGIGSGAKWCILQMQSGYNAVKSVWNEATPEIKRECVHRNHQVPQSNPLKYRFLYLCLAEQISEARRKDLFSRDLHFQR